MWVKNDRVIPICRNCHSVRTQKGVMKYTDILHKPNIFLLTQSQILKLLETVPNLHGLRNKARKNLCKRYIIEAIFDGKCIGCEEVTVLNNLSALEFHHRDPSIKEKTFRNLAFHDDLSCPEIARELINEKTMCLCKNCHAMIHWGDNFKKFARKGDDELIDVSKLIQKITANCDKFTTPRLSISDPFKILVNPLSRKSLIRAYQVYLSKKGTRDKTIFSRDLKERFNLTTRTARRNLDELVEQGFVEKLSGKGENQRNLYSFLEEGISAAKELIQEYPELLEEI